MTDEGRFGDLEDQREDQRASRHPHRAREPGKPHVDPGHPEQPAPPETVFIPVVAESLEVTKRVVDTGRGVRIVKTVSEREEIVDELLRQDELHVERVSINQVLEPHEMPAIRQEGDVTVVPIVEEVIVTEKRRLLKEEVRITRVNREVHHPQRVVLRSEQASVERFDETPSQVDSERRDD